MRLPRIRITVGHLIVAVAVVALNCWIYRVIESDERSSGRDEALWRMPEDFLISFVPLMNVVLIGSTLVAMKWLGAASTSGKSRPPAITFFGLHFLAIGYLFFNFVYGRSGQEESFLDSYFDVVLNWWANSPEKYLPEFLQQIVNSPIFDDVSIAVLISGPLLVFAWIGRLIAWRFASKLSRKWFLATVGLISLGFAGIDLAIVTTPRKFEDSRQADLIFRVVDKSTGQPLEGARVTISNPFEDRSPVESASSVAGPDGLARLSDRFDAYGERNVFQEIGAFSTWGRWLEISANGYQTARIPLTDVLGPEVDLDHIRLGTISLVPGQTPEDTFKDLAGSYHSTTNHIAGYRFEIQPDGRFIFSSSSCTSSASEYGFLKRSGAEIELLPIPRPGMEPFWLMAFKFQIIQWGDCRYFSFRFHKFCKGALTPYRERRAGDAYDTCIRSDDDQKIPTGFPSLPIGAWAEFLTYELGVDPEKCVARNAIGVARNAIGSIRFQVRRFQREMSSKDIERSLDGQGK
jgi:hypothetical protein